MGDCAFESSHRKLKPWPKHPAKIHIWRGISHCGATQIVMFTGNMDSPRYQKTLETSLLPFINDFYGQDHRFQQDNDPKHSSKRMGKFMEDKNIKWWRTPQSPLTLTQSNMYGGLLNGTFVTIASLKHWMS